MTLAIPVAGLAVRSLGIRDPRPPVGINERGTLGQLKSQASLISWIGPWCGSFWDS